MRIALLAPLPPEQTGIADYAAHLKQALEAKGVEVMTPLAGCGNEPRDAEARIAAFDWQGIDLAHGELGGGRLAEFHALRTLRQLRPELPLSATVHDPERLVWRRAQLPWPLSLVQGMPSPLPQMATVMADPLCLSEERKLAQSIDRLVTLTQTGAGYLRRRMRLPTEQVRVIAHGNQRIAEVPLPPTEPLRLLYFGFIYRGKGIEDLLDALALLLRRQPSLRGQLRLTLAGGSEPETAFAPGGSYLDELRRRIRGEGLEAVIEWDLDVPAAAIPALIQRHHVMVLPYRESKKLRLLGSMRGTSGALSWAVACGRGVITSDARSFAEEVASGNGAMYPQGRADALAEQLARLLAEPGLAAQWAERARLIAAERAWDITAERFVRHFETLREVMPHVA
ncbi:MAG: glycosyl transferase family 1 [Pseudomonas sp.]|nr:glycosyltransferase [Pseudomonas sp.]MBA4242561.1 glycosyl transferase family 1 [Pseudomonas sp.]